MAQTVKASAYNAGNLSSIPGLGRSPGEGNGNALQYSCLENPIEREAWQATVHGVTKEMDTTEHAHTGTHTNASNIYRHTSKTLQVPFQTTVINNKASHTNFLTSQYIKLL